MQHNNNGGRQSVGELPVVVQVALLPSPTEENRNEMVQNEFMAASVNRLDNSGDHRLSVAEYAKYLVEEACAEEWLLAICRRAKSKTGVVKLSYGCGYETTVVIGSADADGTPTRVSIGIAISRPDATVGEIESGLWIPCSESIWSHVSGQGRRMEEVSVFVRTGRRKFVIPALPREELDRRRRTIRAWPDPADPSALERMEELQDPEAAASAQPPAPAADAASSKEPPTEPSKKAEKDKPSTKKRLPSMDEAAGEKPKKDLDKLATKKRSSSADEQAERAKKKAKKDPTKPKAALTLDTAFSRDNRQRIKEANPNVGGKELTKLVRAELKQLGAAARECYASEIEADKKRYKEEMIAWKAKQKSEAAKEESEVASGSSETSSKSGSDDESETAADAPREPVAKVTKKKKKPKKDPTKPRGGKSAYNFYLAELQPKLQKQHPKESFKELQGRVGKLFKALSTEEKEKYVAMAKEDQEKQDKLIAEWQAKQPPKGDDTESEDESDSEAAESKKKKKAPKDPNKPRGPKSAYIFYSLETHIRLKETNPEATFAEAGAICGDGWRTLSPEEKEKYEIMAAEDKARHTREMELWKANPTGWKGSAEAAEADTDSASDDNNNDDDDSKKSAAAVEPASPKPTKKAKEVAATEPASPKRKHSHADEIVKESHHKNKSDKKKRKQSDAGESVNETPTKKTAREETDGGAKAVSMSTSKKKLSKKKKKKSKRRKSE